MSTNDEVVDNVEKAIAAINEAARYLNEALTEYSFLPSEERDLEILKILDNEHYWLEAARRRLHNIEF
jgi:hypothetical protein